MFPHVWLQNRSRESEPKFCMHLSFKKSGQIWGPDLFSFVAKGLILCPDVMANINYYFHSLLITSYSTSIFLGPCHFWILLMPPYLCVYATCIYITRMFHVTIKQILFWLTKALCNNNPGLILLVYSVQKKNNSSHEYVLLCTECNAFFRLNYELS